MEHEFDYRLEDLQLVEIQELLEEHGIDLGEAAIADLAQFVKEAGGLEAALEALDQHSQGQKAA